MTIRQADVRGERRAWQDARWLGAFLWAAAIAGMFGAAGWQRTTGPTYPLNGVVVFGGERLEYALVRSGTSTEDAVVEIPNPGAGAVAELFFRRYPVDEPFRRVRFTPTDNATLVAPLPRQPAAGKLEYYVELTGAGSARLPVTAGENPIIRFKDPVPLAALLPHVILMFLAILVGLRAGLGAAVGRWDARYAWIALGLMSVGGMAMGPVVQKHAFGAYWTGFPMGYDLTDNKTLIMWLVWVLACGVLVWERARRDPERGESDDREWSRRPGPAGRGAVLAATAVMLVVYLVPHSLRGSELDYEELDRGTDPAEAIRTG